MCIIKSSPKFFLTFGGIKLLFSVISKAFELVNLTFFLDLWLQIRKKNRDICIVAFNVSFIIVYLKFYLQCSGNGNSLCTYRVFNVCFFGLINLVVQGKNLGIIFKYCICCSRLVFLMKNVRIINKTDCYICTA